MQKLNELPVKASNIKRETEKDQVLVRVTEATLTGWPCASDISPELQPYYRFKDELTIEEGCLMRGIRVIIPQKYQSVVLSELHENHHVIVRRKSI